MNKRVNDEFLKPLKDRPDLTPKLHFKQNLKHQLLEEPLQNTNKKKLGKLIPNFLTVALLFIMIFSVHNLIKENPESISLGLNQNEQINKKEDIPTNFSEEEVTPSNPIKETTPVDYPLAENEFKVYNDFSKDLNEAHLKKLNPISIAKLYVKAQLEGRHDVSYALYTNRKDFILWTKEEDAEISQDHRGTIEQILELYKNIENGKFIQTSDYEGYIEYFPDPNSDVKSGFKMIRNENGIWQVSFTPIQ
ncbi:hypothetical protein [Bacillus sp. FJAT-27445]|uniref:hypothetical protein n=1 Tax=Bacillus sp. FJAT-27445 TaxID=1679166 RepID=UPI000744150B|nr:hypothetical protein [Bacillus sp. FJAT-27445]